MKDFDFDVPQLAVEDDWGEITAAEEEEEIIKTKEKKEPTTTSGSGKIQIDINDVQDLISQLSFSAKELEGAVEKVNENKDINKILKLLSELKTTDIEKIENIYESIEENINIRKIEQVIINKIDYETRAVKKEFDKRKKEIEVATATTTQKYKEYAEAFEDESIEETIEQINKIQKFTKRFSFKTAIFASILTAIITAGATYSGMTSYFELKNQNKTNEIAANYGELGKIMADKDVSTYSDDKMQQLIFPTSIKMKFFSAQGKNVIQFDKK